MRLALLAEGWLLAHGAPLGPTPALHACGTVAREGWPWTRRAIPQPWARGAMFVPKAQGFAPEPRSPGPISPPCALLTASTAFSSGDRNGRNSAGDEKKKNQTQSSIKGELPLASVRCNWIRSLSDLPICGGVSSPGAAQSQSVRPGGAVCSSAGVPADRGDLAFID